MTKDKIILLTLSILLSCSERIETKDQLLWKPGSCSRSCKDKNPEESDVYKFPCSCSSSCVANADCCYDSSFRNEGRMEQRTFCLPVSNIGVFSAIGSCPSEWQGSNDFCTEGFGNLPPVTSRKTGQTYTNLLCAICNKDSHNIVTWNVEMKCCPAHHSSATKRMKETYMFKNNAMWSVWIEANKSRTFCQCKFFAMNKNYSFTKELELRSCGRKEISSCSFSWRDGSVSELCKSYLDPVYIKDKVYRNIHCAICNYESIVREATCTPTILTNVLAMGSSVAEARKFCELRKISSCLHFLSDMRGRSYAISEIFALKSLSCVPPAGRRCCVGEQFDYRHRICRKLKP